MKPFLFLLLIGCITSILYFSWLPDPDFGTEGYLPMWIRNWSNHYYNLRTAVPFVGLGFLLEMWTGKKQLETKKKYQVRVFIQNLGVSAVVVCLAEGGQFLVQNRSPDFMDVFFGILGSMIGSLVYYFGQIVMNLNYIQNEE